MTRRLCSKTILPTCNDDTLSGCIDVSRARDCRGWVNGRTNANGWAGRANPDFSPTCGLRAVEVSGRRRASSQPKRPRALLLCCAEDGTRQCDDGPTRERQACRPKEPYYLRRYYLVLGSKAAALTHCDSHQRTTRRVAVSDGGGKVVPKAGST